MLPAVNATSKRTLSVDITGACKRCCILIFYDPVSSLRTVFTIKSHYMLSDVNKLYVTGFVIRYVTAPIVWYMDYYASAATANALATAIFIII